MISLRTAANWNNIPFQHLQLAARAGSLETSRKGSDGSYLTTDEAVKAYIKSITPEPKPAFECDHTGGKNYQVRSTAGQLVYCHICATFRRAA
jgi:hypothetical protein